MSRPLALLAVLSLVAGCGDNTGGLKGFRDSVGVTLDKASRDKEKEGSKDRIASKTDGKSKTPPVTPPKADPPSEKDLTGNRASLAARHKAASAIPASADKVAALAAVAVDAATAGDLELMKKCVEDCPKKESVGWHDQGNYDVALQAAAVALAEVKQHASANALIARLPAGYSRDQANKLVASISGGGPRKVAPPTAAEVLAAAAKGDVAALKDRLARGANVNAADGSQRNALHAAAAAGHTPAVKLLLEAGAMVNAKDTHGLTPLHLAVQGGHVDVAAALIEKSAAVNAADSSGNTPLHLAAQNKHLDVVNLLLDKKAGANAQDISSKTALMYAAEANGLDIARALLARGASPDLKNRSGRTAASLVPNPTTNTALVRLLTEGPTSSSFEENLAKAAAAGDVERARTILTARFPALVKPLGLDQKVLAVDDETMIAAVSGGHIERVKELLKKGANVNARSGTRTALMLAAGAGHEAMVKVLLDGGANHNLLDGQESALSLAAQAGHLGCVKELLQKGVDVNRGSGRALTAAVGGHRWEIASSLLTHKARPTLDHLSTVLAAGQGELAEAIHKAGLKATPANLNAAVRSGSLAAVQAALKCGADINGAPGGESALSVAAGLGNESILATLLSAKPDLQNPFHAMALIRAAENGHAAAIKALLAAGMAKTWELKDSKETPLMLAAKNGRTEAVKTLLEAGVTRERTDSNGHTARDLALQAGQKAIADLVTSDTDRLFQAAESGDANLAKAALAREARPNAKNKNGRCALR